MYACKRKPHTCARATRKHNHNRTHTHLWQNETVVINELTLINQLKPCRLHACMRVCVSVGGCVVRGRISVRVCAQPQPLTTTSHAPKHIPSPNPPTHPPPPPPTHVPQASSRQGRTGYACLTPVLGVWGGSARSDLIRCRCSPCIPQCAGPIWDPLTRSCGTWPSAS